MELALYCPVCGYYEKEKDSVGKRGDFYTSVSVGSLFGELLAWQLSEWLEQPDHASGQAQILEAGAHAGRLARDVLYWVRQWRPALYPRIEYILLETSPRRRDWQKSELAEFADHVRWVARFEELGHEGIHGIVFSNELLDAMPVHRLAWDAGAKEWFEWGVTLRDQEFIWSRLPAISPHVELPALPRELLKVLPNGFVREVSAHATAWWRAAAGRLRSGRILTFDYGLNSEEFLSPERSAGTLRAYRRHHLHPSPLDRPGELDLTAHVDFSAVRSAGEAIGLETVVEDSQEKFLTAIAGNIWQRRNEFGDWNAERVRQFQTLTHPDHLGRAFRVLVQKVS
jgi:SAM-dependent MidA family methyltransferase